MTIYEKIKADMITAWKAKDMSTKETLSFLLSKIKNKAIELKSETVPDSDVLSIIQKTIKELQDEGRAYEAVGNAGRADSCLLQIMTLTKYLPKQLSEDDIKAEITKLEDKSMPNVMKYFKTNFAGQVDMSLVSKIARGQ